MMPTLEELRVQCRIDDDNEQENALLMMYLAAAREEAEKFLNRTLHDETVPDQDTTGLVITPLIKLRLMQLVGKRKLTAVCSHQTRIGNLDAHLI